jgi:hypothetical protein
VPSIEIVCIGQVEPGEFSRLPFAVKSGTQLKSDRSPRPLFQEDFSNLKGCIYHLGSPERKTRKTGMFLAWDLLSDRSRSASRSTYLEFRSEFMQGLRDLLVSLIESSPVRQLLFTSDWQFGPKRPYRSTTITLEEFWTLHNSRKLQLNGAYPIHEHRLYKGRHGV